MLQVCAESILIGYSDRSLSGYNSDGENLICQP